MHSQKFGPRPDTRNRSNRPQHADRGPKNHHEVVEAAKVSPLQGAARITNLRLLLEKSGGDIPTFAGRAEVSVENLRQILDGQKVMGDELATHVELTLELGQGWLDKRHQIGDITQTTVDILLGKDVSTFEKEIRISEQKGQEIMKNTASTASTPSAIAASTSKSGAQHSGSDKASDEMVNVRISNLVLLTQARGAKSRLARLLDVSESIVSFLFSRNKEFTNSFTRKLEAQLGLPEGWMDSARDTSEVPSATWEKLGSSPNLKGEGVSKKSRKNASAKGGHATGEKLGTANVQANASAPNAKTPAEVPRGQRVHRMPKKSEVTPQQETQQRLSPSAQQGTLSLQLRTSAAPSVLLGETGGGSVQPARQETLAEAPPVSVVPDAISGEAEVQAASESSAPVAEVAVPQQPVSKSTSAKETAGKAAGAKAATAAPVSAAAPTATASTPAPQSAPVPAVQLAALSPAQLSAQAAGTRPDVLELSSLFLSPITEALLKTLAIKAKEGRFTEKDAYRLLGEITEM